MAQLNLLIVRGWSGLGFLSGMVLGLGLTREQRWGCFASWKRRLYQLSHITFFALGLAVIALKGPSIVTDIVHPAHVTHSYTILDTEARSATTALAAWNGF